jgi:hypothetical protein
MMMFYLRRATLPNCWQCHQWDDVSENLLVVLPRFSLISRSKAPSEGRNSGGSALTHMTIGLEFLHKLDRCGIERWPFFVGRLNSDLRVGMGFKVKTSSHASNLFFWLRITVASWSCHQIVFVCNVCGQRDSQKANSLQTCPQAWKQFSYEPQT